MALLTKRFLHVGSLGLCGFSSMVGEKKIKDPFEAVAALSVVVVVILFFFSFEQLASSNMAIQSDWTVRFSSV